MASLSSRKKKKDEVIQEDSDEDSSSEAESENSESDLHPDLEIQVEFEARTPEASDFAGIKRLLQQLLPKTSINLSEITDLILNQSKVGSVLKCIADNNDNDDNNEEDTYGITTVLNINHHKEVAAVRDFLNLVTTSSQDEQFLKILQDPQPTMGWLISERFINIPAHIAPPLYASLWSEIEKARKKGKPFKFDYLLYICKSYKFDVSSNKKKKKNQVKEGQDLMFINAEDELLCQKASAKFDKDVTEQSDVLVSGKWRENDSQMRSFRTFMLIHWKEMEKITTEMEQFAA
ncbi:protein BCCIP homolog [Dendronephthya gigantea]|uniref:protein BCCIP homolog n=1 Tax=Dendronephthya gigantea TaxID=151771 RepID=UPI00106BFA34|nr:protein BCCIP homolog [Dendronephthya gigantea]